MVVFNKPSAKPDIAGDCSPKRLLPGGVLLVLFLSLLLPLIFPSAPGAQPKGPIAVLPFHVHSPQPLDHLRSGLQKMFAERLFVKGLDVVGIEKVNEHPQAFDPEPTLKRILLIGRDLKAAMVLRGSLTQIGTRISLDLKVVDVATEKIPVSVFVVEDDVEKLSEAADKATKSLYAQIEGLEQIDSIEVLGNRRVETEAILSIVDSKTGEALDYDQLDSDLRSIYSMGYFTDVRIETKDGTKGKIVTFVVSEKPSIGSIVFAGNRKIDNDDLKEEIGIKLYSILNLSEVKQSVNRLKEFYRNKGYYTIEIREQIVDLPQNEVSLTYEIDEGEKIYIRHIDFLGNEYFDDDDLRGLMETREKGLFSWFTKSGLLDMKKLEFDLLKITSHYNNHGFIKARTGEPEIFHTREEGLVIRVEVIEGPQYGVREVSLTGDLIKPYEELMERVDIENETFFNRETVRRDVMILRETYADEGYAYVDISPLTQENDDEHFVDVTYRVSRGPKVRIQRINVTGNRVTRDRVIRRELGIIEGEDFSGRGLKKSTANLHRLGFFENVEVQPKKGDSEDLMIVDIDVKERPTGTFSVGAGYSSTEEVLGSFSVTESNLFGRGQKLTAAVQLGSASAEYNIKFVEPWFLGRRLSLGVDLFKYDREYDDYTKDSFGGALSLGIPLPMDDYTKGTVKYTYEDTEITDVDTGAAVAIQDMQGQYVTSSVKLGLSRDSKDRPWNTSKGSEHSLTFEYAGGFLGGDVYFNRYEFSTNWFFPMPWDTVFLVRGRWGYVQERSGGKLPIYQKYFLGGINSVRGFGYQEISPKDPATGDNIGGEKMMVYNAEYRFPLLTEQGVVGLVFFDAGNVFAEEDDFDFSGIKKSAGTGIRWYSPIGPVRLEYGWVIGPVEGEPAGNFEFSIGGVF